MKETKKQIKASLINEVQKSFRQKFELLERSRDAYKKNSEELHACNQVLREENYTLKHENDNLKYKLHQYEDWIVRMQNYCSMKDGARQEAFKLYLEELQSRKRANDAITKLSSLMKIFTV